MSPGMFSTCIQPCWLTLQNQNCSMSVPLKNAGQWEGAGPFISATWNGTSTGSGPSPNPHLHLLLIRTTRNLTWAGTPLPDLCFTRQHSLSVISQFAKRQIASVMQWEELINDCIYSRWLHFKVVLFKKKIFLCYKLIYSLKFWNYLSYQQN